MLLTPAGQAFVSECGIQTSDKPVVLYLSFASRIAWGLEGFGYLGSVLKIIHSGAQVGKTGV